MIIDRRSGSIINMLFAINSMRVESLWAIKIMVLNKIWETVIRTEASVSSNPEISKEQTSTLGKLGAHLQSFLTIDYGSWESLIFTALIGSTTELQQLRLISCFPVFRIVSAEAVYWQKTHNWTAFRRLIFYDFVC